MTKSRIIQVELIALAVVGLMVLYRALAGPPRPDGLVVFTDLEPRTLQQTAFELDRPTRFVIDATGSYGEVTSDVQELAAYAWVTPAGEAEAVWSMASVARPGRGTLALAYDTLALPAGRYTAYFASYGHAAASRDGSLIAQVFGTAQPWRGDRSKWSLVMRALDGGKGAKRLGRGEAEQARGPFFWQAAPVESDETRTQMLEVDRPADVRIEAVGEMGENREDYGWIERVPGGEIVWEMTPENTEPAGGAEANRRFSGTVALQPGLYRATFQTDRSHAYDDWRANPPLNPQAWGMTLAPATPADREAVRPFDPWTSRAPLVALDKVQDDAFIRAQFVAGRPLSVVVQALGEVQRGDVYDYAWIENDDDEKEVWKMSYEASTRAGGASKNRQEIAFLTLDPGTYSLYYQTDDSHAYGDFNAAEPDHPERWGVALFPLNSARPDSSTFRLLQISRDEGEPPPDETSGPPPRLATGEVLLEKTRLGDDMEVEKAFRLEEPATLRVRATGEISLNGRRYDYGWIEEVPGGEVVWEMTWQNTRPAGGHDKNRRFDGTISLPPGRYAAHFRTDLSHAYGDFGSGPPDSPEAWGIVVERVE